MEKIVIDEDHRENFAALLSEAKEKLLSGTSVAVAYALDEEELEQARRDPCVREFLEAADRYLERLELEDRDGLGERT